MIIYIKLSLALLLYTRIYDFIQLVDFHTRETNPLDITFTDDECLVTSVLPDMPLGHSDHTSIVFTLSVSSMHKTAATDSSTRTWYLWHKGDYDLRQYGSLFRLDKLECCIM